MSRKILSIVVLLMAIVLSGCVTSQIRHPDGRVENRYEVLGPSMNYSYGVNRGYAPIGYVGGNGYGQNYNSQYSQHPYGQSGVYYKQIYSNQHWHPTTGINPHSVAPMPHYAPVGTQ